DGRRGFWQLHQHWRVYGRVSEGDTAGSNREYESRLRMRQLQPARGPGVARPTRRPGGHWSVARVAFVRLLLRGFSGKWRMKQAQQFAACGQGSDQPIANLPPQRGQASSYRRLRDVVG